MHNFDPEVCNSCGKCCHISIIPPGLGREILLRRVVCKYLEQSKDNPCITACAIYNDRFSDAPWCMSVGEAYEQGKLPPDCPYVKDDPKYVAADYLNETTEKELITLEVINNISCSPVIQKATKFWDGPMGEECEQ